MADVPNNEVATTDETTGNTGSGWLNKLTGLLGNIFKLGGGANNGTAATTTGISMDPVSAIVGGLGAIANGVFGWLGKKQETKQAELQLDALEKQKQIVEAQGDVETTKLLTAKIDVQKQELVNAQKKETGQNIVKLGVLAGVLLFAGFVVYQVFKTPKPPKSAAVAAPVALN